MDTSYGLVGQKRRGREPSVFLRWTTAREHDSTPSGDGERMSDSEEMTMTGGALPG